MVDIAWHLPAGGETRRADWSIAQPGRPVARPALTTAPSPRRDYSQQALLLARLKSGTVRESQRVTHVIRATPELRHSPEVAARCGALLATGDVQWLPRFTGMPCERCVMAAGD